VANWCECFVELDTNQGAELPAHLLAEERHRIEERKREATTVAVIRRQEREVTLTLHKWQKLWDHASNPEVGGTVKAWNLAFSYDPSITRPRMLSALLVEEEGGRSPLQPLWRTGDTVEHTLFNYYYWVEARMEKEQCVGRLLQPEDVQRSFWGLRRSSFQMIQGDNRLRRWRKTRGWRFAG